MTVTAPLSLEVSDSPPSPRPGVYVDRRTPLVEEDTRAAPAAESKVNMAIEVAVGDYLQCTYRYLVAGQENLNIFHYLVAEGAPADFDDVATELWTDFLSDDVIGIQPKLQAVMSEDVVITNCDIQKIYPVRYAYKRFNLTGVNGLLASPVASPNLCWSITLQGDEAGTGNQGRKQIGGMAEESINAGFISGAVNGGPGDAVTDWWPGSIFLPTATQELRPSIYKRSNPATSVTITHTTKHNTVRTMHRRTVGLGT